MSAPEARPRRWSLSIQVFLLVLLVSDVVLAAGCTWILWFSNGQRAVSTVQVQLADELSDRISEEIQRFVAAPDLVNQLLHDAMDLGTLQLTDLGANAETLRRLLQTFPTVGYVQIATEDGRFLGIDRRVEGLRLDLLDETTGGIRLSWALDAEGRRSDRQERGAYRVTARPWYQAAAAARKPAWSPVYLYFSAPPRLALTAVRPILSPEGALQGVYGADVLLSSLSGFLGQLRTGERGRAFLVERDGMLVAASGGVPISRETAEGVQRVSALDAEDPLVRAAARSFAAHFGSFAAVEELSLNLDVAGETVLVRASPIRDAAGLDWLAFVVVPEIDLLGDVPQRTRVTGLLFLALIALVTLAAVGLSVRVSRPFISLTEKLRNIRNFQLDNRFDEGSNIREVRILAAELERMQAGLVSFTRFVPSQVVKQVVSAGEVATLGGVERTITVLFSDLARYSTIIERLPPASVVAMLNEYLGAMEQVVEAHGGVVLEVLGDAMLVIFGAPAEQPDQAERAVRCALAMRARLAELNRAWEESGLARMWRDQGISALKARVGVHTGPAIVGNMGGPLHMKYGVVGDTVNVASRLEAANKDLFTDLLISGEVFAALPAELAALAEDRGELFLKGRARSQRVYGLR